MERSFALVGVRRDAGVDRAAGIPCCWNTRGADTALEQNRSARTAWDSEGEAGVAGWARITWQVAVDTPRPGVAGGGGWLRRPMRAGDCHASFPLSLGDVLG